MSTAECERDFSAMNQQNERVHTEHCLLFVAVNGPDVRSFPAQKFAEMWIKEGRNAADEAPTGKPKRPHEV